jgi:hypothetical protein
MTNRHSVAIVVYMSLIIVVLQRHYKIRDVSSVVMFVVLTNIE